MADMKGVKKVNLDKYTGKWYEIASFPAWFSRGCENATAEYTRKDDYVRVENTCQTRKKKRRQVGKAFKTKKDNVLKVQFFAPFKSDYIIEFVDNNYKYAIVGTSGKDYLWILSRSRNISQEKFDDLVTIARKAGYDVSNLEVTAKEKNSRIIKKVK
jgi:apolipoprotein D and lipocalin family protein